jgi:hypothetical protein
MRSAITGGGRRSSGDANTDLIGALGADHPLVRTQRAVTVATHHALAASALLVAAPCLILVSRRLAIATEASAAVVTAILWGVVAVLGTSRRQHIHTLILAGAPPALGLIRSEAQRLVDPARRARVARMLDAALHEGEHWHEYLPASRPPPGVRHLPPNRRLIGEITSCLRDGHASPRAMVLLDQLVRGGYGAAVYHGGADLVTRELGRIRFELLEPGGRKEP